MQKPVIIVSGKNGQLGNELKNASAMFPSYDFKFYDKEELDITDITAVENLFKDFKPQYFINASAYTAVDKAETDQENAYLINAVAPGIIARNCSLHQTRFFYLSTDYVFDGQSELPYKEEDETNPINYYGYSKWMGEQTAIHENAQTIIIRTSWVYSPYGKNFVKTMLHLMQQRDEINVVNDQQGSPTYAKDLAEAILKMIEAYEQNKKHVFSGIYHFSNEGSISWFDFAVAIKEIKDFSCKINPVATDQYPTAAKRPASSLLSKEKIQADFEIGIRNWKDALAECLPKCKP